MAGLQAVAHLLELQIHDGLDSRDGQLVEGDHVVDTVQELGAERRGKGVLNPVRELLHALGGLLGRHGHHLLGHLAHGLAAGGLSLVVGTSLGRMLADDLRTHVGGHDDDAVLEVHHATLAVGEPAVIEHLQQDVEHVGMGLLHLVEQHHAVGIAAHGLGQLAALVVAHVSRRRSDQTLHGELLHVLGHVDAHHGLLGIEQVLGKRLGKLGLANTRGA